MLRNKKTDGAISQPIEGTTLTNSRRLAASSFLLCGQKKRTKEKPPLNRYFPVLLRKNGNAVNSLRSNNLHSDPFFLAMLGAIEKGT
jgi:hypothetical protein